MKSITSIILIISVCFFCGAWELTTRHNKDFILIDNENENIESATAHKKIDGKIILCFEKQIIPKPRQIILYDKNTSDTMKIKCYCNYNENIYLQSLVFKEGDYVLNIIEELRDFCQGECKIITIDSIDFKVINTKEVKAEN